METRETESETQFTPSATTALKVRCSRAWLAWLDGYCEHVQLSRASVFAVAVNQLAETSGYSVLVPPPSRIPRRPSIDGQGPRPVGDWKERGDP